MALFACAAMAISSVRAPASPCAAKCCSAAARILRAVAGSSTLLRPRAMFLSDSQPVHVFLGIPSAHGNSTRKSLIEMLQISWRQLHIQRAKILVKVRAPLCSRDRNDVFALRQHPGECQLCRRAMLLCGRFFHMLHQPHILLKIFALETRRHPPEILGTKLGALHLACENSAPQRTVRDEPDAQLAAGIENFAFRVARAK